MLEWARRTIEGGRITAPPGDNLKELLDRIHSADPRNVEAAALRSRAALALGRDGRLALKKSRYDDAEGAFRALSILTPDNRWAVERLAHTLNLRAATSLEKRRLAAALADANESLALLPDDPYARRVLADTLLAMGRHDAAAAEYQRVLERHPDDKRARSGLKAARATRPAPRKR